MCGGGRVTRQTFDAAQTDCNANEFQISQEIKCALFAALQLQGKKSSREAALCVADAFLFRVVEQRRVMDSFDQRMSRQSFDNVLSVLALPVHATCHRGQASVEQPALVSLQ